MFIELKVLRVLTLLIIPADQRNIYGKWARNYKYFFSFLSGPDLGTQSKSEEGVIARTNTKFVTHKRPN